MAISVDQNNLAPNCVTLISISPSAQKLRSFVYIKLGSLAFCIITSNKTLHIFSTRNIYNLLNQGKQNFWRLLNCNVAHHNTTHKWRKTQKSWSHDLATSSNFLTSTTDSSSPASEHKNYDIKDLKHWIDRQPHWFRILALANTRFEFLKCLANKFPQHKDFSFQGNPKFSCWNINFEYTKENFHCDKGISCNCTYKHFTWNINKSLQN